jgi:hypothetical protein
MSTAALTLLVLIASGDANGPVVTSLSRAVREALGPEAEITIREVARVPGDDEAIALGRELHANAVIELIWKDAEHRRATLHFHAEPASSRWTDREVGFDAKDADGERGRMIGFALASMLPERRESLLPPPPFLVPPPMPSDEPEPPAPAPKGEVLRWFGAVDVAASGSLGGDATGIGAALAARWDFAPKLSLRLAGGLRSGNVTAADADSLIFDAAAGLVWRAVRATTTSGFGIGVRADALAIQYRLSRGGSHATLWLPGADLALEGSFMFAERMALFAAVGGEAAFGATDVFLFSERVTTISPIRGIGQAGIRIHF